MAEHHDESKNVDFLLLLHEIDLNEELLIEIQQTPVSYEEEEIFIPDDIHEEDLDSLNFDEVQFSVPEITFVDDQNPVASPLMIDTVSFICEKCGKKYKR